MKLFAQPKANAIEVPRLLLKELGVRVSDTSLADKLEDHPNYPSIVAISDVLKEFEVATQSFNMPNELYHLESLLFPLIAHSEQAKGKFLLVHQIANGIAIYSDEQKRKAEITEDEFLKMWSGMALYAEADADSGEEGYALKQAHWLLQKSLVPVVITVFLLIMLLAYYAGNMRTGQGLLLGLKILGLATTSLLLAHSINANNPLVQNLCGLGKKNNCNAILRSPVAQVTSWLSWSEVGFFYFAGSLLSLIFVPSSLFFIVWLNILALPYTFWSLYYQYSHKNWCVLCCVVQAILWLEFITALVFDLWSFNFVPFSLHLLPSAFYLVLSFLSTILLWSLLKPVLKKATQHKFLKNQLKKLKYDNSLFNHALTSQTNYQIADSIMPVTFGSPSAKTVITMVSNPFCGPCARAHQWLENWLATRDDLQLKIIFSTADHDDDQRTKVAKHIAALSATTDEENVENALNDWYALKEKTYENWANKYPVQIKEEVANVTELQKQWCKTAEITFTPTILINGYKLPETYRLEDLKYLIS